MLMTNEAIEKIWDRFIELVAIDLWGETEVLARSPKVQNLIGSADKFRELYKKAARDVEGREYH